MSWSCLPEPGPQLSKPFLPVLLSKCLLNVIRTCSTSSSGSSLPILCKNVAPQVFLKSFLSHRIIKVESNNYLSTSSGKYREQAQLQSTSRLYYQKQHSPIDGFFAFCTNGILFLWCYNAKRVLLSSLTLPISNICGQIHIDGTLWKSGGLCREKGIESIFSIAIFSIPQSYLFKK